VPEIDHDNVATDTRFDAADAWVSRRSNPSLVGIEPAAIVHHYELIRELGRGGMGRVVLARDTKLGRRVAIKFLTTTAAPAVAQRFLTEARTTAQLAQENIVVVHEVNVHQGVPFMVLEYLEGESLRHWVRDGGVPWPRVVEVVVPILRALVHAHASGIVHRDMKPDNVMVTRDGLVKVLDFGIAKAFTEHREHAGRAPTSADRHGTQHTVDGAIMGTIPYMSPEQLGLGRVDVRSDLWAVGVILWELLAGRHPLGATLTTGALFEAAAMTEEPMPSIGKVVTGLPDALEHAIAWCLTKPHAERVGSAAELLAQLEPLLPGRLGRVLAEGDSPYIGLAAFQETDATRFFGRERDVVRAVARLAERPLVALAGPSGAGKSSFVRAGVIPMIKASIQGSEAIVLRPGRAPFAALASSLASITTQQASGVDHATLAARLRAEPGLLGTLLRARARQKGGRLVLFVDQFEELFTLVTSEAERAAFTDSLAAVADDPESPLRVVLAIRSDFLDRVAEHSRLVDEVTRGLMLLSPPDASGLRDALMRPLELAGYRFEDAAVVDDMLANLRSTPGALPLLQFVASRLWDARDRQRRLITASAYQAMGGITGALSAHADEAVAQMRLEDQRVARLALQRLVTPERTRAIVDAVDLLALAPTPADGQRVLDQLVQARLLIVQARDGEPPAVELVHESLITGWPRLRRWLDESQEEAGLAAQLATAAKQWEAARRPAGLLWRGDTADQARKFAASTSRSLLDRERAYLDAVIRLATRATRIKRFSVGAIIAVLSLLVVAGATALTTIRGAEQQASSEATRAREAAAQATAEAERALRAERLATEESLKARAAQEESASRLREIQGKDRLVEKGREDLGVANSSLKTALATAESARATAEAARLAAVEANAKLKRLLAEKEAELKKLQKANRPF